MEETTELERDIAKDMKMEEIIDESLPSDSSIESHKGKEKMEDLPEETTLVEETKMPLVLILDRDQTRESIEDKILHGAAFLSQNRNMIDSIRVPIKGWEHTNKHPVQIEKARKKYADAIDWGLMGFFLLHDFKKYAQEVYCVAYADVELIEGGQMKFDNINFQHMEETSFVSVEAYIALARRFRKERMAKQEDVVEEDLVKQEDVSVEGN